jgi:virginiamycin A acetyltransferase
MPRPFLDATKRHPITLPSGDVHKGTVYLNRVIDHPNFEIGDYSYYSDFDPVEDYAVRLAPYLYPGAPERLIIGKFAQIAHGVRIITSSANHPMGGFSTYPFAVLNPETMTAYANEIAAYGDTVVGNDVWIGYEARILPGVTIGDGAIVGAGAIVSRDVPPYAIVGGNPAGLIRIRFPADTVAALLRIEWWNWEAGKIERHAGAIGRADMSILEKA